MPVNAALALRAARTVFADGQFVLLAVEIAGQAQAELARIQPVILAAAFGMQAHGADDQAAGASLDELIMQRVAEAAAFIDGVDRVTGLNLFLHPLDQPRHGETLRGLGVLMVGLNRGGDLLQVHVQTQLDHRSGLVVRGRLCCSGEVMCGIDVSFHTLCRVPVLHARVNPPWHLTADCPGSFDDGGHLAPPFAGGAWFPSAWLSCYE